MFIALFLLLVGVLFLLRNTGLLPGEAWGVVWPLVLIALGAAMLFRKERAQWDCWPGCPCVTGNGKRKTTHP
jgi:cell wall-active antibiotic response 4TMS protein YvqF